MASIRGHFDQQLDYLSQQILRMGSLVDEAIKDAIQALVQRDSDLARQVINNDKVINDLRYQVEEQCYILLATQQPLAGDLRRVAATISIVTNMERMADHAAGVAALSLKLNNEPKLKPYVDLPRMADIARDMLRRALDGYITADAEKAFLVAKDDLQINQLDEQVLRELLSYMIEDPRNIRRATYLLWISHNLERIGDRCKNICERVVYVATGELADFDDVSDTNSETDEHDMTGNMA